MKREIDIVVLSDVHLGTYACHAKELLNYLKSIEVGTLILNGDFIDMWHFKKRYFPKEHLQVIQRILKMASRGTKVYYITGNNDEPLRRYTDFSTGNIHLRDKLNLQLKGKTYLIFHGDLFDLLIKYPSFLSRFGGKSYQWLIRTNRSINKLRRSIGLKRISIATEVKTSIQEAQKYMDAFESAAYKMAHKMGYDYIICGHLHQPNMSSKVVNEQEVTYLNAGDWVENLTALEYKWGRWSIYEYDELDYEYLNPKLQVREKSDEAPKAYSPELLLNRIIQQGNSNTSPI